MADMRITWASVDPGRPEYREGIFGYPGDRVGTIKVLPTDETELDWYCEMLMEDYNWTFKVPTTGDSVPEARTSIEAWLAGGGQAAMEKKLATPPPVMQTLELPNPIDTPIDIRATRKRKNPDAG